MTNAQIQALHRNTVYNALMERYPDFRVEYRLTGVSTRIADYRAKDGYAALRKIYDLLLKRDKSKNALKTKQIGHSGKLEDCDMVLRAHRQIIEFDEAVHHFHDQRRETFKHYPSARELPLGFDKDEYARACTERTAKPSIPSIWNDVLRDFLPLTHGFEPTVRIIYDPDKFEGLSPCDADRGDILRVLGLVGRLATKKAKVPIPIPPNHDEAKNRAYRAAFEKYGCAYWSYPLDIAARPEDYGHTRAGAALLRLFQGLQRSCGYKIKIGIKRLDACDIFIPKVRKVIELDERQHFSVARAESLKRYGRVRLDFDRNRYIEYCMATCARDPDPPYRDGQRAWFDTIRDHIPLIFPGFQPTRRVALPQEGCAR